MFYEPDKNDHGLKYNPFKSICVPRPIAWVSSLSGSGVLNLAPFSQFQNVAYDPPYVMFAPRANTDTALNIHETSEFVVNMATWELREVMNASSAEFASEISEPERVGIEMCACVHVKPPRVARSPVVLECKYNTTVRLTGSDGRVNPSSIVFGEVVGVHIDDSVIVNGEIDVVKMRPIARLGYMDYAVVDELFTMQRPGKPADEPARQPVPQY